MMITVILPLGSQLGFKDPYRAKEQKSLPGHGKSIAESLIGQEMSKKYLTDSGKRSAY